MSFKEYASKNYVLEKLASLGSPITSWNDLTDKPFGKGDVLYRFGQEDIIETISQYAKINNEPANYEETFFERTYILYSEDGSVLQTGQLFNKFTFPDYPGVYGVPIEINVSDLTYCIYVVAEDNTELFGSTLSKGIWVDSSFVDPSEEGIYLTEIIDLDKTLDEKYIPKTIARVEDVESMLGQIVYAEWDVNNEYEIAPDPAGDALVKLSDNVPNPTDLIGASMSVTYEMDGEVKNETVDFPPNYIVTTDYGYILGSAENPGFYFITAESAVIAETTLTRGIWTQNLAKIQGYLNFKIYKNPVIPKIFTAKAGQTIVVKAIDENGKPTEWEAVDMPTGGAGAGLPPVTAEDEGKILAVVNGVWTAITLPNAEEASF